MGMNQPVLSGQFIHLMPDSLAIVRTWVRGGKGWGSGMEITHLLSPCIHYTSGPLPTQLSLAFPLLTCSHLTLSTRQSPS